METTTTTFDISPTSDVQVLLQRHDAIRDDATLSEAEKEERMKTVANAFCLPDAQPESTLPQVKQDICEHYRKGLHHAVTDRLLHCYALAETTLAASHRVADEPIKPTLPSLTTVLSDLNKPHKFVDSFHLIRRGAGDLLEEVVVERHDEEVKVLKKGRPCEWSTLNFSEASPDEAAVAVLVSGVWGSGKTILGSLLIQKKLQNWQKCEGAELFFVRISLSSGGGSSESDHMLNTLSSDGISDEKRNALAVETMEHLFKDCICIPFVGKVKRLVIIIDQIGKCLNLAKGCIAAAISASHQEGNTSLFSFAENTFLIFCGGGVEFVFNDSNKSRLVCIQMRDASPKFYESLFRFQQTLGSEDGVELPAKRKKNEDVCAPM